MNPHKDFFLYCDVLLLHCCVKLLLLHCCVTSSILHSNNFVRLNKGVILSSRLHYFIIVRCYKLYPFSFLSNLKQNFYTVLRGEGWAVIYTIWFSDSYQVLFFSLPKICFCAHSFDECWLQTSNFKQFLPISAKPTRFKGNFAEK